MQDYLLDIVEHTVDIGCIDTVKIKGDDQKTLIYGIGAENVLILHGKFKSPIAEFIGTSGMPNLNKLKILLNLPIYKETPKVYVTQKEDTKTPEFVHFENSTGDFHNSYRLMAKNVVDNLIPDSKFNEPKWDIDFVPSESSVHRLRMQLQANSDQPHFQAKTENGNLKFFFGNPSTHGGGFVFQPSVGYNLKRARSWPALQILSILGLVGDKRIRISDDGGAMIIDVDSGLAEYQYIIPAQSK